MLKKFTKFLIILGVIALIMSILYREFDVRTLILKKLYKQEYSEYVNKYANINGIDPMWIYAIIKVESNFDKDAISNSGAKGLMQLMDETAGELAKQVGLNNFDGDMLFEPEINIMLGTKYFDSLLAKYNENYYLAIAAYNGGIGNVDSWIEKGIIKKDGSDIENIPYKETNMYVRKTINSYSIYNEIYNNKEELVCQY